MGYEEFLERSGRQGHTGIQAPTAVVRTTLHHAIGGYLPELPHSGDTEIWLRMAAHAAVAELAADQAYRRLHDRNMSLTYSPLDRLREQKRAFDIHFAASRETPGDRGVGAYARPHDCSPRSGQASGVRSRGRGALRRLSRVRERDEPGHPVVPLVVTLPMEARRGPCGGASSVRWRTGSAGGIGPIMAPFHASRSLHVLLELSSADLRIGAVNDALDLAELAAPLGGRFTLCGPLTPEFREAAAARGAHTLTATSRVFSRRELPLYAWDVMRWTRRLRRLRPQVVHLNYPGWGPSLAYAARLLGIPVVVRAGALVDNNLLDRWASAYAANCDAQAEWLLDSPFADRVVVTGDLFRPDRIRATMTLERALPPRRGGLPRIIFLGQIVERKGIHVLVDAMARLKGEAELLLVGGDWSAPGYAADLGARARLLGVDSWIHFATIDPTSGRC
jgi:hypothetical protein